MFRSLKNKFLIGSLLVVLTTTIGATFCYLIAETGPIVNIFKPFLNPYGNLRIEKQVDHPFGEEYLIPEKLTFDFRVDLGAENADKEFESSLGEKVKADRNGVIELEIRPDIPVTIMDIPSGTEVVVTEIQNRDGFAVKGDKEEQTITILSQETKTLEFTNIYQPEPVKNPQDVLVIEGMKLLKGREWLQTDEFSFELKMNVFDEEKEENVWKIIDTATVTDSTPFGFAEAIEKIKFNETKIYSFCVSEVEGNIDGILYTKDEVYFDVVVGDADMDGYYEIQEIANLVNATAEYDEDTNCHTVKMTFTNTYSETAESTTCVVLEFYKRFFDEWGHPLCPAGFSFGLYSEDDEFIKASFPTTAVGEAKIFVGRFDESDVGETYTYKVKEIYGGKTIKGVTFDDSEYEVTVEIIKNANGTLCAVVKGDKKIFVNTYNPKNTTAVIEGTKVYEGNELKEGEFSFALYEADACFKVADEAEHAAIVKNAADGRFSFETEEFERPGIYHFVVKEEVEEPFSYVKYDQTEYYVTVVAYDVGGKLKAEVRTVSEYGCMGDMVFVNKYVPAPAYLTLEGTKVLDGMELSEGMFGFDLYEADDKYNRKEEALGHVTNDTEGRFVFEELVFTEEGTYYYVIGEDDSKPLDGVEYDATVYCVKVTVTDDKEGQLEAVAEIMLDDGRVVDEVVFTNNYKGENDNPIDPDDPIDPEDPTGPDKPDEPDKPGNPDKPEEPVKPGESEPSETPQGGADGAKTGDQANIFLYLTMFFDSGAVILAIYLLVIRKKKEL